MTKLPSARPRSAGTPAATRPASATLFAGMANPSPDPLTMLILGGTCPVLVEAAEFIVWSSDRRQTRLHPDPYPGLADDELSPLQFNGRGKG